MCLQKFKRIREGCEDLEGDSRSGAQKPGTVSKVCELVVRDHQMTLELTGDHNFTFNQEMIHQIP
jgi:hypothetical protein